jgi:hypothetical protein
MNTTHYPKEYSSGWLNCLDELMNSWLNKFCPGFLVCGQKPWPFGNDHSIADGDENMLHLIMWQVLLVNRKDQPKLANGKFAFASQFEERGERVHENCRASSGHDSATAQDRGRL